MIKLSFKSGPEDFFLFETMVYNDAEFSMHFTTPYDYLGLYESVFPMTKTQKNRTNIYLSFSYSITELMFFSA